MTELVKQAHCDCWCIRCRSAVDAGGHLSPAEAAVGRDRGQLHVGSNRPRLSRRRFEILSHDVQQCRRSTQSCPQDHREYVSWMQNRKFELRGTISRSLYTSNLWAEAAHNSWRILVVSYGVGRKIVPIALISRRYNFTKSSWIQILVWISTKIESRHPTPGKNIIRIRG